MSIVIGIRRAEISGRVVPSVSVFRSIEAGSEAVGMSYVVFVGNVGDENTVADVIASFEGRG